MSRIDYQEIYGTNFNSFEEFRLPIVPGKHLIIGEVRCSSSSNSNGSGKSSLFESLPWTQYKKTNRSKDISRDYKGDCKTGVNFKIDKAAYTIDRYWKDKKYGNTVKLYKDGEEVSHRKSTSTEEEIQQLIGIPYDIFITSCVVMQGLPTNFTALTPTARKIIIEEILGFSVWDEFRKKFSSYLKEIHLEKQAKDSEFINKKDKMTDLNARVETLKQVANEKQTELGGQVVELKNKIKEVHGFLEKVKNEKVEFIDIMGDVDEISTLQSSLAVMLANVSDLKTIILDKICPKCKQDYPESRLEGAGKELNLLQNKIKKVKELTVQLEADRFKYTELTTQVKNFTQSYELLQTQLGVLASRMTQPNKQKEIESFQTDLDGLVTEVNILFEDLKAIGSDVENLKYLDGLMLPSSKFRTYVLKKYMGYLNSIIESVVPLIFDGVVLTLEVNSRDTGIELKIVRGKKEIEYMSLSGGEKRRLDIVIILAFQRFLIESSGTTTNLLVFDEIFDGLDATGIDNVLSCMDALFPESSSVYVITHNDSIKSLFSSVIKVVKENNISYIEGGICADGVNKE